jgi:hypothetical protein
MLGQPRPGDVCLLCREIDMEMRDASRCHHVRLLTLRRHRGAMSLHAPRRPKTAKPRIPG